MIAMAGPRTKFIEVECECGTKQKVFSNCATTIKCQACGNLLAEPTGGKANIRAKQVKHL